MGGLTSALALAEKGFKHINVYESASDLGFVGAGIQLAPNMARVLDRLGVWKGIEAEAVNIEETSVRGMYISLLNFLSARFEQTVSGKMDADTMYSRSRRHGTCARRSQIY
jgi:2-polyprenyl-6-methoxyphenol hydroxylase-like FAD-dependent oxidoreductase